MFYWCERYRVATTTTIAITAIVIDDDNIFVVVFPWFRVSKFRLLSVLFVCLFGSFFDSVRFWCCSWCWSLSRFSNIYVFVSPFGFLLLVCVCVCDCCHLSAVSNGSRCFCLCLTPPRARIPLFSARIAQCVVSLAVVYSLPFASQQIALAHFTAWFASKTNNKYLRSTPFSFFFSFNPSV